MSLEPVGDTLVLAQGHEDQKAGTASGAQQKCASETGEANKANKASEPVQEAEWAPKIVGFACRWCSYAGADLAGTSRMSYPATVRLLRVPCSGRVNPAFIMKAFQRGADAVLVAGCHPGDCHYTSGNLFARRRLALAKGLLEYLGMEPERLQIHWISAAEGQKFARVASEMSKAVEALGRNRKMREEI